MMGLESRLHLRRHIVCLSRVRRMRREAFGHLVWIVHRKVLGLTRPWRHGRRVDWRHRIHLLTLRRLVVGGIRQGRLRLRLDHWSRRSRHRCKGSELLEVARSDQSRGGRRRRCSIGLLRRNGVLNWLTPEGHLGFRCLQLLSSGIRAAIRSLSTDDLLLEIVEVIDILFLAAPASPDTECIAIASRTMVRRLAPFTIGSSEVWRRVEALKMRRCGVESTNLMLRRSDVLRLSLHGVDKLTSGHRSVWLSWNWSVRAIGCVKGKRRNRVYVEERRFRTSIPRSNFVHGRDRCGLRRCHIGLNRQVVICKVGVEMRRVGRHGELGGMEPAGSTLSRNICLASYRCRDVSPEKIDMVNLGMRYSLAGRTTRPRRVMIGAEGDWLRGVLRISDVEMRAVRRANGEAWLSA